MTAVTSIEQIAAPARLDRHVAAMVGDEPTLTDISAVLHLISTHEVDAMRMQALCALAARALGKFDARTRYAPPSALAELVADSLRPCKNERCFEQLAPWDEDTCGDRDCINAVVRMYGDER